uniref:Uncharacterized protein n=1 Tax=Rhizophora mucronata TaxID=61149 RepID=A0A2P2Q642_RHIMU
MGGLFFFIEPTKQISCLFVPTKPTLVLMIQVTKYMFHYLYATLLLCTNVNVNNQIMRLSF